MHLLLNVFHLLLEKKNISLNIKMNQNSQDDFEAQNWKPHEYYIELHRVLWT